MRPIGLILCLLPFVLACGEEPAYGEEEEFGQPMLGIRMTVPSGRVMDEQDLDVNQGVLVLRTFPDTAAADMDIRPDDIIIQVNDRPVGNMSDLRQEIAGSAVGDPVTVVVRRDGQDMQLESYLGDWPSDIPYQELDPAMEQRYRDAQMRRYLQRAESLEGMRRLQEQLAQDVLDLQRLRDERDRNLAMQDPDRLADLLRRRDQAAVLRALQDDPAAVPFAWRFAYDCRVNRLKPVAPAERDAAAGISYGFTVDSEGM
jgi:hypothetical protein